MNKEEREKLQAGIKECNFQYNKNPDYDFNEYTDELIKVFSSLPTHKEETNIDAINFGKWLKEKDAFNTNFFIEDENGREIEDTDAYTTESLYKLYKNG